MAAAANGREAMTPPRRELIVRFASTLNETELLDLLATLNHEVRAPIVEAIERAEAQARSGPSQPPQQPKGSSNHEVNPLAAN